MGDPDVYGRVAYAAYVEAVGGKSAISGEPLPTWDAQRPEIREAWRMAWDAVFMVAQLEVSGAS